MDRGITVREEYLVMKKKLICLTLSILMLLSCVLTSCSNVGKGDETDDGSDVDTSAKTITMWVMTSEETTERAKELVAAEFTKITKSLYKTNVVLKFCTEAEYYEKLEGCIEALNAKVQLEEEANKQLRLYLKAHKGEKSTAELTKDFYEANPQYAEFYVKEDDEDKEAVETEEETIVNEYGIKEIKYPDEKENQVDIFYISGYGKYMEYYNNEWLASLSEELSSSSRKLTDYVSPSLLNGVQVDGGVYAIPNNVPIGEYTYMMIDKALFDEYYNKIDNVKTVLDLSTFLNDMKNRNGDLTPDDPNYVVPLASTFEECMKMLVWYWELSYVDLSVYETYYDEEKDRNYVLQKEYIVESDSDSEDENAKPKNKTKITASVIADQIYKTNELGQYLDADGNVLNYRYAVDNEGGWVQPVSGKVKYAANAAGAKYLVDEFGNTVTAENDKRVRIDAETAVDNYGNTKPTFIYDYNESSDFSIVGQVMKDPALRSRGKINVNFNSLFSDSEFRDLYLTLSNYSFEEYYGEPKDGQLSGVSFVKGDSRIKQEYEKNGLYVDPANGREYYVVVAEYPEASEQELYGNMFAVYAESAYLSRAMEVITRLNTNTELRNLLQYGIRGKHYELNEDGTAHLLTSSEKDYGTYRMDIEKTGNCFIAAPEEGNPDAWTYAKIQNNDSLINPLLGFDFNTLMAEKESQLDTILIDRLNELSAEAMGLLQECADKATLSDLLNNDVDGLKKKYTSSSGDSKLTKALNSAYDPEMPLGPEVPAEEQSPDPHGESPYTVYTSWLNTYGYLAKPKTAD